MTEADLEQAAAIEAACFREPWSLDLLSSGFENKWNLYLAAEEDGRLAGYGAVCVIAGEGEIQRIAVLEEFRRQGLGRKLLDAMVAAARNRGARAMTLEVRESNEPAIKLYFSAGFRTEAQRKDYYRNPREDALIMWNRSI
ncbi:MAG TPA: ribosomal protein S18-alanine N-acetyltransferase [Candidatus Caccovicinus merdipullorum]|uniref:[Ribosomal protein bS18]-alanine N-acetyltransferase n=1 Tax=Candidatus Caccovicinus merdipullorum TaxID=2840724 RepID=A0A9D1GK83_9FIRM|nr:ribosomal protein S18-alanine N-acetyltransferase [Candidatus Caccovicinus merdipullorum]